MAPPPRPVVLRVTRGGRHQGLEQRGTCEHSVRAQCFKFLHPEHIEGSENSCTEDMVPLVSHRLPQVFCGALGASSDGGRSRTCSQGHALGTAPFLPSDARRWARGRAPGPGAFTHHWLPLLGGRWGLWWSGAPLPPAVCVEIAVQCICGDRQDRCDQEPVEAGVGQAWASVCLSGGTKPSRAVGCLRKGVESAALASGDLLQSWQGLHFLDEQL